MIVRAQQMLGKDANYVPGWDCHGLPIEWKIEEKYRAEGRDKDSVPIRDFRRECREFAGKWIEIQKEEFKRLGGFGDWDNPYTTMDYRAESQIVTELGKFLMNGGLYRGAKPVLWSVVEKTALAEAEVEYHDHTSDTIFVRFPVVKAGDPALEGASVVIWTTTPWTIPGNRAVAYGPEFTYGVFEVKSVAEGSLAVPGERLVIVQQLAETARVEAKITEWELVGSVKGLEGTVCHHPFHGQGYDFDVRALPADFVTLDTGTGVVQYRAWSWLRRLGPWDRSSGVPAVCPVDEGGTMTEDAPMFAGVHVFKANPVVMARLAEAGKLLAAGKLIHSYPHSWRSKAPLIFRNTPQWFISMDPRRFAEKSVEGGK